MISNIETLSSTAAIELSSNLDNFTFSSVERTFSGGFSMVFYDAFTNINDISTKNFSNFYLTNKKALSAIIENPAEIIQADEIFTTLEIGGQYVNFSLRDDNEDTIFSEEYGTDTVYGDVLLSSTISDTTKFFVEFLENNSCRIYFSYDSRKYYLVEESLVFYFISDQIESDPTTFKYIYSESINGLYLFYHTNDITYRVGKTNDTIGLVVINPDIKIDVMSNYFKITKDIYTKVGSIDFCKFINYDISNNINKYEDNLLNNYLLHRTGNSMNIVTLGNQLLQNNVFSSANNLLSSQYTNFFVDNLRDYTSIFQDIPTEIDEDLTLNYVFYNKPYKIKSGVNSITAPSDMTPFTQLNINDTKFVNSGSFPYPTPEYADKVFLVDDNKTTKNGQYLLCTWLSGSPLSENVGVWVDRYYYPDLISKEDALVGENIFNTTYENEIENLIQNNALLIDQIDNIKFFDKKSDMVFVSDMTYEYHRLSLPEITESSTTKSCNDGVSTINYFKKINDSGLFTASFYFNGNDEDWTFTNKGGIEGGLTITKNGEYVIFNFKLYDTSSKTYTIFTETAKFKRLKLNFISVSVNTVKGVGYFFLNQTLLQLFTFEKKQYYKKYILFSDFVINDIDVLSDSHTLKKFRVDNIYTEPELSFLQPIIDKVAVINDITITLPCGMRNSSDNLKYLQVVCSNNAFKSNKYNIIMKNIDVKDDIKDSLENFISTTLQTPATSNINTITFETFK